MFQDNPQADHQPKQHEAQPSPLFEVGPEVPETANETNTKVEITAGSAPANRGSTKPETTASSSEMASVSASDRAHASAGEVNLRREPAGREPFEQGTRKPSLPPPTGSVSRRVAANRANAKKSTGPRTARGKAISRFNATRHGLLARKLANKDGQPLEEGLEAVMEGLREKYGTGDITVELLLETTVVDYYRTAKALEHENRIFSTRWSFAQQGEMPCLQRYVTASRNALLKDLQLLEELRARQVETPSEVEGGDSDEEVPSDPAGEEGTAD